jgi:TonB family protein
MQPPPIYRYRSASELVGRAGRTFAIVAAVLVMASPCAAQGGRATLTGRVADSTGAAVVGAEVTLVGFGARALSDAMGVYRLRDVPLGRSQLVVRRLGFRPAAVEVDAAQPGVTRVDVRLVFVAKRLAAVEVRERRREVYDARLAGFNQRATKRKSGYFVTRERIERAHSQRFVDLLREVPGVRIRDTRAWGTIVQLRGRGCPPLVFVDGFPASAAPLDLDVLDLGSVEGIEIYASTASAPSELVAAGGMENCGVIAVWSRPARPRARAGAERAKPVAISELLDTRAVYTYEQVDTPTSLSEGSATPIYPDSLWRARVAGRVVIELVVDTAGAVEPGTLGIVSSTHPAFSDAVRVAMGGARFEAATRGGRKVRQLVQLPFAFAPPLPE